MYDRILFPTDGSDAARRALDYAGAVASTHDATLHILNVVESPQIDAVSDREDIVDELEREGERIVEEGAVQVDDTGIAVVTDVRQGVPHETIGTYCESNDIEVIVMPTHGRTDLDRFLLGSVTEHVINTVSIPTLTVTPDESDEFVYPPADVLVPTDGSENATRALEEAIDISSAVDAKLHLLHVIETPQMGIEIHSAEMRDELERHAKEILTTAADTARTDAVETVTDSFTHGYPYREILSYIEEQDIDLVVLGARGTTEFSRYEIGGVSTKLLRTSPIPVLMIRQPLPSE